MMRPAIRAIYSLVSSGPSPFFHVQSRGRSGIKSTVAVTVAPGARPPLSAAARPPADFHAPAGCARLPAGHPASADPGLVLLGSRRDSAGVDRSPACAGAARRTHVDRRSGAAKAALHPGVRAPEHPHVLGLVLARGL